MSTLSTACQSGVSVTNDDLTQFCPSYLGEGGEPKDVVALVYHTKNAPLVINHRHPRFQNPKEIHETKHDSLSP